ncbi:MAG TPA: hypothetical protein PLG16_08535, partial [Planctomycetota bacterium]|nr:hypothetical protein [Planctomycetota bacterium]
GEANVARGIRSENLLWGSKFARGKQNCSGEAKLLGESKIALGRQNCSGEENLARGRKILLGGGNVTRGGKLPRKD